MSSTKYCVVYNSSSAPYEVDVETGKQVLPGDFAAVQRSAVKDRIDAGDLVVVDPDTITDLSAPSAWAAKQEYMQLTAAWEAEKAGEAKSADYDDSKIKDAPIKRTPKSSTN